MKKIYTILIALMFVVTISKAQSGITWSAPITVAIAGYQNHHPRITLDAAGNPLVLWGDNNSGKAYFTRWNGSMFVTPMAVNPGTHDVMAETWAGPDIASHGDTVYMVYKREPEGSDTNHIFMVHSYNGGMTFSMPVQVDFNDSLTRFPTVTTNSSGNPLVGFMRFNSSFGNARWTVAKSNDYGMTFSPSVLASGWSGGYICDCCPGAIISSGNNVAMSYRDANANYRNTWAGISTNGGSAFTNGMRVDQNNWMLMSCPSSGPDGFIIGDTLYSAFMSGASGMDRCYYSKSSVSNLTAGPTVALTGSISGLTLQNYPRMANNGNAAAIVWKQTVSNNDQLPVLFTNNIANGFPTMYDTVDLNNITNADVVLGINTIHVVWEDDGAGVVRYRKGTFNAVITNASDNLSSNLSCVVYPNPANTSVNFFINSKTDNQELLITDVAGREVHQQLINGINTSIDVSRWSNSKSHHAG